MLVFSSRIIKVIITGFDNGTSYMNIRVIDWVKYYMTGISEKLSFAVQNLLVKPYMFCHFTSAFNSLIL
jgi:hypothetical protein